MKLHILSDLHFETQADYGDKIINDLKPEAGETLVLAGDIARFDERYHKRTVEAFQKLNEQPYEHILYVPGNHEYWGSSSDEVNQMLVDLERDVDKLQVLRTGKVLTLDGHRFLGDTMWVPYNPNNFCFQKMMPDFRAIRDCDPWIYQHNERFRDFLKENIKEGDVVVTHHSSSYKSVPDQYQNSQINRFFVSDMADLINKHEPALWVHGHTHTAFDYQLANTRVVCNPRGYPGELEAQKFNPRLIIELKD